MIHCKQKGPHQQVRFRLSLSVLPTAPGIASLASPAHSPSPRALPSDTGGGVPSWKRGSGHHPGTLMLPHSTNPRHRMVTCHCKVFLELSPDRGSWHPDPGISQLPSIRALLEARRPSMGSGGPTTAFAPYQERPRIPWGSLGLGGSKVYQAGEDRSLLLIFTTSSLSLSVLSQPCEVNGVDEPA